MIISSTTAVQLPDSFGFVIADNKYWHMAQAAFDERKGETEESVVKAIEASGFKLKRTEMTGTNFYFSRLLEAVRVDA